MEQLLRVKMNGVVADLKAAGFTVETLNAKDSDECTSITLKGTEGNKITFGYSGYSGIHIFVPKKPEYEEKFVLSGKYKGLDVAENFGLESEANRRKEELEDSEDLKIEKTMVEV